MDPVEEKTVEFARTCAALGIRVYQAIEESMPINMLHKVIKDGQPQWGGRLLDEIVAEAVARAKEEVGE